MNKKQRLIFLIITLVIILSLISIFSIKSYNKYIKWNEHKNYFEQEKSKQKIEDWMILRYIGDEFNIDLKEEFNVTSFTFLQKRLTLNNYCSINNINCTYIIKRLNSKIKKKNEVIN